MKSLIILAFFGVSVAAPYWPKMNKSPTYKDSKYTSKKAKPFHQFDLGSNFFSRTSDTDYDYINDYASNVDVEPSVEYQSASDFVQSYQPPPQPFQQPTQQSFPPHVPEATYLAPDPFQRICNGNEVLSADGLCVEPEIIRNIYTFSEPENERVASRYGPPVNVPKPKVKFNLVVIQANEDTREPEPIIVPPPQEKTVVLVLKKEGEEERRVIEVPAPAGLSPEVFFVNYRDGENPVLPGGIDLETALASSATQGTRINPVGGTLVHGGAGQQSYAAPSEFGGSGYNRRSDSPKSGSSDDFHKEFERKSSRP